MKTIKANHKAEYEPIADLVTYRAMPTNHVAMNQLDPFIFLNHHGWQEYSPNNNGLPFGPHPHRGFETVTFILEGDLTHKDSSGATSVIKAGGVQWMTAGSGLVHAEISSDEFKKKGGPLEILQLWVNLPAKHKMTQPNIPVCKKMRHQLRNGIMETLRHKLSVEHGKAPKALCSHSLIFILHAFNLKQEANILFLLRLIKMFSCTWSVS